MNNPISTYRLQFHKDFTFKDLDKTIPYLHQMGVKTVYASPIFEATPGSVHGYDGMNPHRINPEIGTEEELLTISEKLHNLGIQWLQDIVPNHMAFDPGNPWLLDVLEKGQRSVYASFFDVPWTGNLYRGKIMIPFLGKPLNEVIESGELKIKFAEPRFVLQYFSQAYPVSVQSYATILDAGEGIAPLPVQQLADQIKKIKQQEEPHAFSEPLHELQLQLTALMRNEEAGNYIKTCLDKVNGNIDLIKTIANNQVYQLCNWQKTDYQINFRRFFTVNGLICLNMQHDEVFEFYHSYIQTLVQKNVFQGLRIDHIDGLFDPEKYLKQLRQFCGPETYIVVEKILEPGEEMPEDWPIQGNTGYDFLSFANNVLTARQNDRVFTDYYEELVGDATPVHDQIEAKKAYILNEHMGGELTNLHRLFLELNLVPAEETEVAESAEMKETIGEFLIRCPVYRYYGNALPLSAAEAGDVAAIIERISLAKPELRATAKLLIDVLLHQPDQQEEEYKKRALRFYQRCMQFTGPLMAKGVEDTLMFTYNRFAGHNEVGDAPDAFGISPGEFHTIMQRRQSNWPLSLNGTSTHDTKRGEDVRARLNVLTDIPAEWLTLAKEWKRLNAELKLNGDPDDNDEYLIYQTLVGAYPLPGEDPDDFETRIQEYLQKALREAKVHSNWATPDEDYEAATKKFAVALLDQNREFWKSFETFQKRIADFGVVNSLAQVVLKFTCPGVPDIYQGTELWDLSLVDPDNRRPVDYNIRTQYLKDVAGSEGKDRFARLWQNRFSGQIKLDLIRRLLQLRAASATLFTQGVYLPLSIIGEYKENILAYARKHEDDWVIIIIPLHLAALCKQQQTDDLLIFDWKNTAVTIPGEMIAGSYNILNGQQVDAGRELLIKNLFNELPMAILKK